MLSVNSASWVEVGDRSYYQIQLGSVTMAFTTRKGGLSMPPFTGFNLALHVEDALQSVIANRQLLLQDLNLPSEPCWLNQVHGTETASWCNSDQAIAADACMSSELNQVCAVMTADCIPILAVSADAKKIVAIHAGWRGLAAGIVQKSLALLGKGSWVAIGPHIQQANFEVGAEVRENFVTQKAENSQYFTLQPSGKYTADLGAICRTVITQMECNLIDTSFSCTFADAENFFSFRRDGQTGRMASLIWRV